VWKSISDLITGFVEVNISVMIAHCALIGPGSAWRKFGRRWYMKHMKKSKADDARRIDSATMAEEELTQ
jgi:hypothetical protein